MSGRIAVIGSINMDMVVQVDTMPAPGETVHGSNFTTSPGGKGANQAVAAARLGGDVTLIGQVGSDAFADDLLQSLREAGVQTGHVRQAPGPSGCAVILVDGAGRNSIAVVAGANGTLLPAAVEAAREGWQGAAIILAQLEIPLETVLHVARAASAAGIPFLLDPAPAQALPADLLRLVTWLTPNETECATLLRGSAGDASAAPLEESVAAQRLLSLGPRNVVLKLGARGVYLAGADIEGTFVPAPAVKAVDTTAAGDAFNGAFACALAEGMAPVAAAQFACRVAAVSVTRPGAQASMPHRHELA